MIDYGTLITIVLSGCVVLLFVKAYQQHREVEDMKKAVVGAVAVVRILASLPLIYVKAPADAEEMTVDSLIADTLDRIRKDSEGEKRGEP